MTKSISFLALVLVGCGGSIDASPIDQSASFTDFSSSDATASITSEGSSDTNPVPSTTETTAPSPSTIPSTGDLDTSSEGSPSTETVDTTSDLDTSDGDTSSTTTDSVSTTEVDTTEVVTTDVDTSTSDEVSTSDESSTNEISTADTTTTEVVTETSEVTTSAPTSDTTSTADTTTTEEVVTSEPDTTSTADETTTEEIVLVCVPNAACADDNNPCTNDVCSPDGLTCNHPAKGNGTSCGSSNSSSCDAPDTCMAGQCVPNHKAPGTSCDTDSNPCTSNVCNGNGTCSVTAAPANTVCDPSSCEDGILAEAATCGGQTTCPSERVFENCYGSCNAQGSACEVPGIQQLHTSMTGIQQLQQNSNEVFFAEAGQIRRLNKTTKTVSTFPYTADGSTVLTLSYPSDSYLFTVEIQNDWATNKVYCSALNGGAKVLKDTLVGSNLTVVTDNDSAFVSYSINMDGVPNSVPMTFIKQVDCNSSSTPFYTTGPFQIVIGNPVVTATSVYLAVMDWGRNDGFSHTYGNRVLQISKSSKTMVGSAEDFSYSSSQPNSNIGIAIAGGKLWYRTPDSFFSMSMQGELNGSMTWELDANEFNTTNFVGSNNYLYHANGPFKRLNLVTKVVETWTEHDWTTGVAINNGKVYFQSNSCYETEGCVAAIYSMPEN